MTAARPAVPPIARPLRVLSIEDNPADARLHCELLRDVDPQEFEVVAAPTLTSALGLLRDSTFDVALTDLSLPDSEGLETVRSLRAAAPDLPVVVITGLDDRAASRQATTYGAQDYLVKGRFDGYSLAHTLRLAIERQRLVVALGRRARQQQAAANLGQTAVGEIALQELFQQAVERVAETLEVEICHLAQAVPGTPRLVLCAGVGWRPAELGNLLFPGGNASLDGYTVAQGETVVALNLGAEHRFDLVPELRDRQMTVALSALVGERERPFGTISVLSRGQRDFDLDDAHFLETVASLLASAVQRERALEGRRRADRELEQARRLEALGRLASGIAHDFNNSLTAILFSSEVLMAELPADGDIYHAVSDIHATSMRASEMVAQLVAFGRQQGRRVQRLDLNELVTAQMPLLRRILGSSFEVELRLQPELAAIEADRSQLQQILFYLLADGRDAMPTGGALRVETSEVESSGDPEASVATGRYVMLSVHETGGAKMKSERGAGPRGFGAAGSGLEFSRSPVYGIVEQNGGYLTVESGNGGNVLRVFLPRATSAEEEAAPRSASPPTEVAAGEGVLLVEDDAAVRELVADHLGRHGYRVWAADGLDPALEIWQRRRGEIDLVLIDVLLPGGSGLELEKHFAGETDRPPRLYMSGDTASAWICQRVAAADTGFLPKPFTVQDLLTAVRRMLDAGN